MSGPADGSSGAGAGGFDLLRRATQAMMSRYAAIKIPHLQLLCLLLSFPAPLPAPPVSHPLRYPLPSTPPFFYFREEVPKSPSPPVWLLLWYCCKSPHIPNIPQLPPPLPVACGEEIVANKSPFHFYSAVQFPHPKPTNSPLALLMRVFPGLPWGLPEHRHKFSQTLVRPLSKGNSKRRGAKRLHHKRGTANKVCGGRAQWIPDRLLKPLPPGSGAPEVVVRCRGNPHGCKTLSQGSVPGYLIQQGTYVHYSP